MAERASSTHTTGAHGLISLERVVYVVALAGLAIQALTGFVAEWVLGDTEGWPLFVHMLGAPLFLIGLVGVAIVRADRCRFGTVDTQRGRSPSVVEKLLFWVALVLGSITGGSMLAAMLPVFGYAGQEALHEIHETGALLLVIAVGLHLLASLAAGRVKG